MNAVVLQRADQFQPGAVADVRQARIAVAAEIALQNFAVLACGRKPRPRLRVRARAPGASLACSSAMRQLLTYWPPRMVSAKWTRQLSRSSTLPMRRRHAAFGHDRVRLAEQRFADQPDFHARRRGFDGRAQTRAARADDQHVVFKCFVIGGHRKNSVAV